ncbi:thioesterase II family protein [Streptomyces flavofungini]|uniref:thioesterase II family protein n=1 Tax=Streptomyces flavofungini TaxID=68200 RepID=UPI0025B1440E|nr:thioesterase domain-containing protein [Streptomyces flavofungini]WJV45641.1 thioesterase domain-containing protein [Streptomyces flavofungini]
MSTPDSPTAHTDHADHADDRFERWFPGVPPDPRLPSLLCLAGSGAGPGEFRPWKAALSGRIEVAAVALPGREHRAREPNIDSLPELVTRLKRAAAPLLTAPFALFGYSTGALVMYELARSFTPEQRGNLLHLFVGGQPAPRWPQTDSGHSDQSDAELIDYLRRMGGTPEEVLNSPPFMRLFLRALRADLRFAERYDHPGPAHLPCPLTLFAGQHDAVVPPHTLPAWVEETARAFRFVRLPGAHFTLRTDRDLIIAGISALCGSTRSAHGSLPHAPPAHPPSRQPRCWSK